MNVYVLPGSSQHSIQKDHGEELKRKHERATWQRSFARDWNFREETMKTKPIIYCVLILLALFSAPASADHTIISGDVNNDRRLTAADSLIALQMAVGSISPDIARADVNHDGMVSSLDALMILLMVQETGPTAEHNPKSAFAAYYSPVNITVDPRVTPYQLPVNLSNISNIMGINREFELSARENELLMNNGFVILDYGHVSDIVAPYEDKTGIFPYLSHLIPCSTYIISSLTRFSRAPRSESSLMRFLI